MFFDPLYGRVEQKLPKLLSWIYLNCLAHFNVVGTGIISPTNKMHFICSKEKLQIVLV